MCDQFVDDSIMDAEDKVSKGFPPHAKFVLGTNELRERCLTGGYNCFPICVDCLDGGNKVVTRGRKNEMDTWKEKEKKAKAKEVGA